ncbi:beta-aspartyl-dipeptidase (metallo-type) [Scopulibacillus darangshiensis]|uniref:Isoaspartyl dipeptidase n=1 Tax=Scopulibacillus darangshiensis TaxID=442528 RepID=A0A4R2P462_9BACL|nr:beta-aspartyl-peptidase [Scopulibacillus darangshiensis]TCP29599.1 beta-aspartyl-dipeptidase (metallo-type) [Scopulibacillus darangshiensis]
MLKLIKNAKVYAPDYLGLKDLLLVEGKIYAIEGKIEISDHWANPEIIDADGRMVIPGLIDQHVHLIGGGGELGFASRTPEVMLSNIIKSGITTVVGLLGTDGTARHIESLLAKAKGLEDEGITTFIHTGSYGYPSPTLTGHVKRDIMFIDKIIGVKIALSDHRSSQISSRELTYLASEARVGGMLSGKPGMVHIHMGDGKGYMTPIIEAIENSDIPIHQFVPTHVARNRGLFDCAIDFTKRGGNIDITSFAEGQDINNEIKPSDAVLECLDQKVALEHVTLSSDGNGSIPKYDADGRITGIGIAKQDTLWLTVKNLVKQGMDLSDALLPITSNVAKRIGAFPQKGRIAKGCDADLVMLNDNLDIDGVIAKGQIMMQDGRVVVKGTFEGDIFI